MKSTGLESPRWWGTLQLAEQSSACQCVWCTGALWEAWVLPGKPPPPAAQEPLLASSSSQQNMHLRTDTWKCLQKTKTFPCPSTWGKDYSTNKTWQMFNIICNSSCAFTIASESMKIKTQKSFLYSLPASPMLLLLTFTPHLPNISHGKMKSCSAPNTNTVCLFLPFLFGPLLHLQRRNL